MLNLFVTYILEQYIYIRKFYGLCFSLKTESSIHFERLAKVSFSKGMQARWSNTASQQMLGTGVQSSHVPFGDFII